MVDEKNVGMEAITNKLVEVLRRKADATEVAKKLIMVAKEELPGSDEWDIRRALWRLTADGRAHFKPGFKEVLLSN